MRFYLRLFLFCGAVAFFGGTMVGPLLSIKGVGPDFTILALVILSLAGGTVPGTSGGFVLGLIQDLATPNLLGLHALCKTGLGFTLGRLRGRLVHGMPLVEASVVFLSVLAHDLVFLVIQANLVAESDLFSLVTRTLPSALYTGLIGIPLLRLADFLGLLYQED